MEITNIYFLLEKIHVKDKPRKHVSESLFPQVCNHNYSYINVYIFLYIFRLKNPIIVTSSEWKNKIIMCKHEAQAKLVYSHMESTCESQHHLGWPEKVGQPNQRLAWTGLSGIYTQWPKPAHTTWRRSNLHRQYSQDYVFLPHSVFKIPYSTRGHQICGISHVDISGNDNAGHTTQIFLNQEIAVLIITT